MNAQKSTPPKKKPQKGSPISLQLLVVALIIIAALFFFIWHQMNFRDVAMQGLPEQRMAGDNISVPDQTAIPARPGEGEDRSDSSAANDVTVSSPAVPGGNQGREAAERQSGDPDAIDADTDSLKTPTDTGAAANNPVPFDTEAGSGPPASSALCRESARTIHQFYQHLDEQPYIQNLDLNTSSEDHFTALIQKLLDNPPVVSGETNDLFTILQNTAHFFRIIGKDNILLLKAILDQEKDRYEYVLADHYTMLHIPGCLEDSFNLRVPPSSPYEYAGFFLSTMGGRLYLFRRDSMSRMIVSFYAILLIDEANRNASNKYGIEIAGAIDQLIEEMESTTYKLQLKNIYLDKLYDLKEQYQ